MSKDKKKTMTIDVEIVDNCMQCFTYIYTTLEFWKLDKTYPGNFLKSVCIDYAFLLENKLHDNKMDEVPF